MTTPEFVRNLSFYMGKDVFLSVWYWDENLDDSRPLKDDEWTLEIPNMRRGQELALKADANEDALVTIPLMGKTVFDFIQTAHLASQMRLNPHSKEQRDVFRKHLLNFYGLTEHSLPWKRLMEKFDHTELQVHDIFPDHGNFEGNLTYLPDVDSWTLELE